MSQLYLVPTPIGNLGDMTLRAIEVLKEVDMILAEDTRKTGILLKHYQISKPVRSHHKFNEHRTVVSLVTELGNGTTMALVTDAGTPGISDPGFLLVRSCIEAGIQVEVLPGPAAFIPALVGSGIPCDRFVFEGFLPPKKGRMTRLKELSAEKRTIVLYESPHRLVKTLEQLSGHFGNDRRASVSRELTKIHEETKRGTLADLSAFYSDQPARGEIVIVIEGAGKSDQ
ncbi:MAG: 16S rRNA (cytidine(1402)-2'-O)-methyltransferase [Bacteroidales bacterium]